MDVHLNCWNETDELKCVVVCGPSEIEVPDQQTADDVQWEKPVSQNKARENHHIMVSAMEQEGVKVIDYSDYLSTKDKMLHLQLINRVFVRDLGCVFGNELLPGEAGTSMRRPEYVMSHILFNKWFDSSSFPIEANNSANALEYGDVLILNKDAVFINTGLRTSMESIQKMKEQIFKAGFSEIGVIDLPRRGDTMHLDMNGNVVGKNLFLAKSYMRFFPVQVINDRREHYEMMEQFLNRHGFEVIWSPDVKPDVRDTVANINFLNLNPETLLISSKVNKKIFSHHPELKKKKLIEVDVAELEKGGGGIRCMTLPFERRS
ncbi:arginine deiminase family protein [Halobacillus mangrovi]|uniref:arginine deiminase family protein n=1 Tax=Halobacillus mangrovi TaxID=402384 RepID=UPI003D973F77